MDVDTQNSIQIIKKRGYSAIESLSHPKLEKKKIDSAEDGWRAFLEMGEDGFGSELHNASEEHDKYLYQKKIV